MTGVLKNLRDAFTGAVIGVAALAGPATAQDAAPATAQQQAAYTQENLRDAIAARDITQIRQITASGFTVTGNGNEAVQFAAMYGVADAIPLLAQAGAPIDYNNGAVLRFAINSESPATVAAVLDAAAAQFRAQSFTDAEATRKLHDFINAADGHALAAAARIENPAIMLDLLTRGADIHASEEAALRGAANDGLTANVKILLDAGADPHARNGEALQWARENGHTDTAALLNEAMTQATPVPATQTTPPRPPESRKTPGPG